jgi:hypothetical protein
VVVGDLDVGRPGWCPGEADAPSVVDADAVLSCAAALQLLETVAGWNAQVGEVLRRVGDQRLPVCHPLQIGTELADVFAISDVLGLLVGQPLDQRAITKSSVLVGIH